VTEYSAYLQEAVPGQLNLVVTKVGAGPGEKYNVRITAPRAPSSSTDPTRSRARIEHPSLKVASRLPRKSPFWTKTDLYSVLAQFRDT
jgi:hypothetical protein